MTIQRMEHVGIVVDDLAAGTEFFVGARTIELAERIGLTGCHVLHVGRHVAYSGRPAGR